MESFHIVPTDTGWELRKQGATRPSKRAQTKDELLEVTSAFLANPTASVKIHKRDGTLQEERTYPRSGATQARPRQARSPR